MKKEELVKQAEAKSRIDHQKALARLVFPAVEQLKTVYDAQTVFNAVAGHIKYGLILKENSHKVSDLTIDMEKGKESDVKHAVRSILGLLEEENAKNAGDLLELMGAKLPEFLANRALKGDMSTVTAQEFIAD